MSPQVGASVPPVPLETPDWTVLLATAASVVQCQAERGYTDEDSAAYIYEAAMKAIYGDAYFKWLNRLEAT